MNSYIYMEDLVANALIENIKRNNTKQVKFAELNDYGAKLIRWWSKNKNINVTILISKYYTTELLSNYSDFFILKEAETEEFSICLRDDKTVEDLCRTFRPYLSIDMLNSFIQAFEAVV